MNFSLYMTKTNKKIERTHVEKYVIPTGKIKLCEINKNENINSQIIDCYKTKPDVIIFNFNRKTPIIINKIPKYPILHDEILYITPICIQQVNGFPNNANNVDEIVERSMRIRSCLMFI